MIIVPNYYHKFKCIADKCQHNCCIGWEIDIDEETMAKYNSLSGKLAKKIRANIEGDVPHFVLGKDERCPFLNEDGLCDIIAEYGEEMLCEICSLHPRFRNFYSDFAEMGLGLCCEEAARIILLEREKFAIIVPEDIQKDVEEAEFFQIREHIFGIVQDREKSIKERFCALAELFDLKFEFSLEKLRALYLSLERLDDKWTKEIEKLAGYFFDIDIFCDESMQIPFEQLCCYFVFRHISEAMWDGDYAGRVNFALMSCYFIGALFSYYKDKDGDLEVARMIDIVRMYSSEVEYSEENMEKIIKKY